MFSAGFEVMALLRLFMLTFSVLIWTGLNAVQASERITGFDIKAQAKSVVTSYGTSLELMVSDKRTFFKCGEPLTFSPRMENDWSTVEVNCASENWSTVLRNNQTFQIEEEFENTFDPLKSKTVVVRKNITKGEVLTEDHLAYSFQISDDLPGGFTSMSEVIGRKAKFNLARGAVIKTRQLEIVYPVEKGKAVLVVADNSRLSITVNAIALEAGQLGDMIKVKNSTSGKILNAIVTGEKKVSPLTNM
jgi:flagella basal body P-ring formation protein FlgA